MSNVAVAPITWFGSPFGVSHSRSVLRTACIILASPRSLSGMTNKSCRTSTQLSVPPQTCVLSWLSSMFKHNIFFNWLYILYLIFYLYVIYVRSIDTILVLSFFIEVYCTCNTVLVLGTYYNEWVFVYMQIDPCDKSSIICHHACSFFS